MRSVGTLDALHLASMEFLRARGQEVALASYDDRLNAAARRFRFLCSRCSDHAPAEARQTWHVEDMLGLFHQLGRPPKIGN